MGDAPGVGETPGVGEAADPGEAAPEEALAARLAEIWAMIAQADPELAKRVPGYLTAAD